jgi:hypothetical protein
VPLLLEEWHTACTQQKTPAAAAGGDVVSSEGKRTCFEALAGGRRKEEQGWLRSAAGQGS